MSASFHLLSADTNWQFMVMRFTISAETNLQFVSLFLKNGIPAVYSITLLNVGSVVCTVNYMTLNSLTPTTVTLNL